MKPFAWVLIGAIGLAVGVVAVQRAQAPTGQVATLVSLPVFASDGRRIGEVVQIGVYNGQKAVIANLDPAIGVRPQGVLIPRNLYREKADRIEIALTTDEVKKTLAKE
jgi:hypothetical protein